MLSLISFRLMVDAVSLLEYVLRLGSGLRIGALMPLVDRLLCRKAALVDGSAFTFLGKSTGISWGKGVVPVTEDVSSLIVD